MWCKEDGDRVKQSVLMETEGTSQRGLCTHLLIRKTILFIYLFVYLVVLS